MRNFLIAAIFILTVVGCSKGGAGDTPTAPPPPVEQGGKPTISQLSAPANNTVCLEGQDVSETESAVTFSWGKSDNTDEYELHIEDLISGASTFKTTKELTLNVNLKKNRPYRWYVVSKSSKVKDVAQSLVWRFYSAGQPSENYAPFPASNLSPALGASVEAIEGKISLSWTGKDVDDDIKNYDIYLGQDISNLTVIKEAYEGTSITGLSVQPGVYYWKVVTRDQAGNLSETSVYSFSLY